MTAVLNSNGIAVHWREDGASDGIPVIFANSLGTDLRLWDALIPHLPSEFRYIRYDLRGHGLTECTPHPYKLGDLVTDVEGLIQGLNLKSVVFIGVSLGGMIGQGLAIKRPDLLASLVLLNTSAIMGSPEMWNQRISSISANGIPSVSDSVMHRWFGPKFISHPSVALWQEMLNRTPLEGYLGCCTAIASTDLSKELGSINQSVLCVAGSHDLACEPNEVKATSDKIPRSSYRLIEGVGHLPCVEKPKQTAAIISDYLKEIHCE